MRDASPGIPGYLCAELLKSAARELLGHFCPALEIWKSTRVPAPSACARRPPPAPAGPPPPTPTCTCRRPWDRGRTPCGASTRASPATRRETNRPRRADFIAPYLPYRCPAGVASTTTRKPCSRAKLWEKQKRNRIKPWRDICMRVSSRGEGKEGAGRRESQMGGSFAIRRDGATHLTCAPNGYSSCIGGA